MNHFQFFSDDSFVPISENLDYQGKPRQRDRLLPNAVPTLYLDHTSKDFKDYRAAEIAKEKQTLKKSANNEHKKFLILKCNQENQEFLDSIKKCNAKKIVKTTYKKILPKEPDTVS